VQTNRNRSYLRYCQSALPLTLNRAHDLPVNQYVKVTALVSAVLNSRRRIVSIVQGNLTLGARNAVGLFLTALSLILTANYSQADLGWTLAQFEQRYGKPVLDQQQIAGRTGYVFNGDDYIIAAFLRNSQVSRILYICRGGSVLDWKRAKALLLANAPEATWDDASKNEADNLYRVNGTKDGEESYYASLTNDGKMLAIWTKEDDEAGSTKPKLDTPPVSSVVGSNGKNTGEGLASIESEAPRTNRPDVPANATSSPPANTTSLSPANTTSSSPVVAISSPPANATSSSPVVAISSPPANATSSSPAKVTSPSPAKAISSSATHRAASTHASHTKIARAKNRSTVSRPQNFRVANYDAKARSAATSHQNVGSSSAAPTSNSITPNLMNAGTELYNSDYTQPFKNAKKAP
jgi:hypothetical protein